jgi:TPR repeat protein
MYLNGVYIQLNGNEAMKWIKASAENGYAPAQTEMGYQHRIGKFVQRDDYEGLRWYKLAADQGDVNAIYNIGNIYEAGEGASKNPAIAAEWYLKAAKGGNDSAQLKAGLYYELGTGVAKNMTEAIKWYKAAAEQGDTTAFYNLGLVYEFGKSVPVDLTEALRYYSLSSEKGNIDAKVKLAKMYRDGKGREKDPASAFKLMMEAALAGDAEAQNEVGVMTELGIGTAKDELGARQWYVKSADQGNMFAMFNVGLGLEYGKGGKGKSMANAIRWYERAAEKGHEKARQKLTEIYKKDLKSDTFQDLQITISCPPEKHCRVEVTNSSKNLRYSNIQLEITYDDPSFYGQQQRHEMTLEKGVGPNASETWTIGLLFGESPKSLKIKILKADAGAKQAPLVPASKLATPVLSYELTESRAPVFESTTSEPVLLRYKLRRDQIMKFVVDTNSDIEMRMGAQKLNMGQNMRIEAKARVTEVDDKGNISALVKITRLKMKINGMTEVEFDSDKPDDADPDFKAVTAMIGVGIPCKISPVGEMLETDLEPLRLAVRRVNNAALTKALEDSTSKMFEGTFVQLSRDAIAAGQTYKAGTIVSDKMKMHMSYKIDSVNSDKSMVVMSPVGILDCAADAIQDAEAKIISQEVSGWLLFDVEKGYISNGQVRSHVVFEFTANGQKIRMDMLTKALSTSNLN